MTKNLIDPSQVALVRCESYQRDEVTQAVRSALDLLGGPSRFADDGETVLLKPNVLVGEQPSRATTTHPEVFAAVGTAMASTGARLTYGDSGGIGKPATNLARSGLSDAAAEIGAVLADFQTGREVSFPESPSLKSFWIAGGVREADAIISIGKMKAHGFMRITGAVKNTLGCIPGLTKAQLHLQLPQPERFAGMLVALNLLLRPRLYVLDGVVAMEGNGPRGGDPVPMHVILASSDPVALDSVFCRLIDLDPGLVHTNVQGVLHGLGQMDRERIEVLGDPLSSLKRSSFRIDRRQSMGDWTWQSNRLLKRLLAPRPVIDQAKCVRCGQCVKICPTDPKAVAWHTKPRSDDASPHGDRKGHAGDPDSVQGGRTQPAGRTGRPKAPPQHNYRRCIRCFCCQEICPERAIRIHQPLVPRLFRHPAAAPSDPD